MTCSNAPESEPAAPSRVAFALLLVAALCPALLMLAAVWSPGPDGLIPGFHKLPERDWLGIDTIMARRQARQGETAA